MDHVRYLARLVELELIDRERRMVERRIKAARLTPQLAAGWREYRERWQRLLDLNPRMAIADKLGDVSETHDFISFPTGWEHIVRDWVRAGMPDPAPFDDRNQIDTPAWRAEFMAAAKAAGPGWVFHADSRDVIFEWRWDDDMGN